MTVYVYKEYCDWDAYGDEIIKVFSDKDKAIKHLISRVEGYFHSDWKDIRERFQDDEDNTVTPVSVVIEDANSDYHFWMVETCDVIK